MILIILLIVAIIIGVIFAAYFLIDRTLRASGYHGPVSDHFDGVHFYSIRSGAPPAAKGGGFAKTISWMMHRQRANWEWQKSVLKEKPKERVEGGEIRVTFVGHATLLIQTEGLNILTDPVWSCRASPFAFVGPARYSEPGIPLDALPPIDIVLLSHNHYDHMDLPTLKAIVAAWNPKIFTSLGNAEYLSRKGISNAKDFDWWNESSLNGDIKIVAVPAQHFSARAISDRNKTLWCGFVIETRHGDIYFAGDTAYGPFVRTIHERYPKFRLALLPIGAYLPQWLMQSVHASPDEALKMHHELAVEHSIGIHFGTFRLADDGQYLPPERLRECIAREGSGVDFKTLDIGGTEIIK